MHGRSYGDVMGQHSRICVRYVQNRMCPARPSSSVWKRSWRTGGNEESTNADCWDGYCPWPDWSSDHLIIAVPFQVVRFSGRWWVLALAWLVGQTPRLGHRRHTLIRRCRPRLRINSQAGDNMAWWYPSCIYEAWGDPNFPNWLGGAQYDGPSAS